MATRTKNRPVAKKRPQKRVYDDEIEILKYGDFFSAKYNKKKIRGIVEMNNYGNWACLYNAQDGFENENREGFRYYIPVDGFTEQDLANARVTEYKVFTDKRQKEIVWKDILPEFEGYKVRVDGDTFTFGCGSVELERRNIEGFLRFRSKHYDAIVEYSKNREEEVGELSVAELKNIIKYRESLTTKDGVEFAIVEGMATKEGFELTELLGYGDAEIKALLKYADRMKEGVK